MTTFITARFAMIFWIKGIRPFDPARRDRLVLQSCERVHGDTHISCEAQVFLELYESFLRLYYDRASKTVQMGIYGVIVIGRVALAGPGLVPTVRGHTFDSSVQVPSGWSTGCKISY
jgi:hypothetical protein